MRLICVTWRDASRFEDWAEIKSMDDSGFLVHSIGFLAHETLTTLFVARDFDPDDQQVRGIVSIPKAMIEYQMEIEDGWPR